MAYYLAVNRGLLFHFGEPLSSEIVARAYTNHNREIFRTHPGHRRPDLRAQTEEEEHLLREQLALQLDERLWAEGNA